MSEALRLAEAVVTRSAGGQAPMDVFAAVAPWARRALGYAGAGWILIDPASGLITGLMAEDTPSALRREFIERERLGGDVNHFVELAATPTGVGRLSAATGGDLSRSDRYRSIYAPAGFGDELRGVLRVDGTVWGSVCIARAIDEPWFDEHDEALMGALMADLAPILRQAVAVPVLADSAAGSATEQGVLLLDSRDALIAASGSAVDWLGQLPEEGDTLPAVVYEVAGHARLLATARSERSAQARVRTCRGSWCVVRAVPMGADHDAQIAVVIEAAAPGDLAAAIARLHGLSPREQEVAEQLVAGRTIDAIAEQLWLSPHTVRDHIKSAYAKLGARTRPELTAMLLGAELVAAS